MKPAVVLVGVENPGNVGVAARAMKNFGFDDLVLVDPPRIEDGDEAYGFAGSASDVLDSRIAVEFDDVVREYHTVGFTARVSGDQSRHVRHPFVTPDELVDELRNRPEGETPTALVFGRERVGLSNDELRRLDTVCSIPASEEYPVLNLGQAVTVALYELSELTLEDSRGSTETQTHQPDDPHSRADPELVGSLHSVFSDYLRSVGHPSDKHSKAETMFRRFVARAEPTEAEVRTLIGVLKRGTETAEEGE